MESLRFMLNYWNQKELVASQATDSVQIWKRGFLQDEYGLDEIEEFYLEREWLVPKITAHLTGKTNEHLGHYDRLQSHLIHYIMLRDKPFILVERDANFKEVDGVPQFCQTHLGLTAWTSICKLGMTVFEVFAGPFDEIECC